MKKLLLILLSFSSTAIWACTCTPLSETKRYSSIEKKWHSTKFTYTCRYECKSRHAREEEVTGTHEKRIFTRERGDEIVCDGTLYKEYYNTSTNWFSYKYIGTQSFDPRKSSSQTLRGWGQENCL